MRIVLTKSGVALKAFDVPPEGADIVIVVNSPELQVLGDARQTAHVPADSDSEPVLFELQAPRPGPQRISITAWKDGTYLGELAVEVIAERGAVTGVTREHRRSMGVTSVRGEVSLVVRFDPRQGLYRFEFRDIDNPAEVTSDLVYDAQGRVEQIVRDLDVIAGGDSNYTPEETRDYLVNAGANLWQEIVPEKLREQFWSRRHRIKQLTILSDRDAVPWELLYPKDPGLPEKGFLVEQFPVMRSVFGRSPARDLRLRPARFVLPPESPTNAADEVDALSRVLDYRRTSGTVVSGLTQLTDLIKRGQFGLLHFACHNTFTTDDGGSWVTLDGRDFKPLMMRTAQIDETLKRYGPLVFINACRSAGRDARYNRLDNWAEAFLGAGAAAFIGSLWAVRDRTARDFAEALYDHLKAGKSLGESVTSARKIAAKYPGDPTWLAYTVYGNAEAKAV